VALNDSEGQIRRLLRSSAHCWQRKAKDSEATLACSPRCIKSGVDQAGVAKDEKQALAMLDKAIEQGNANGDEPEGCPPVQW
jgi:TPR repeat protein